MGVELQTYRIDDFLFVIETRAVAAAGRRIFRATAYVLMACGTLRLVQRTDQGVFATAGPAVSRARDELVHRLSSHLRAVALRQGGIDAAACERLGTWDLPA